MSIFRKLTRAMRGDVSLRTAFLEGARRSYVAARRKRERERLKRATSETAKLTSKFQQLSAPALLSHFQQRTQPQFFVGFDLPLQDSDSSPHAFKNDDQGLVKSAERITNEGSWPLFGNAHHKFIDWHRDPFSGYDWPLDFYGDIRLQRNDGSDVRAVWELNRLGHLLTLAEAFSLSRDPRFSAEFFRQVESWDSRNPFEHGVNWNCAMEVALRAINLSGAFAAFRRAPDLDSEKLVQLLRIFDQHGRFIHDHLEFSYIATSNHYLSNVVGLLWLGILLPELAEAPAWRAFGLRELKREMNKQVLADGADYESSTGYHRLVLQLFLYSFMLCRQNAIEIEQRYWHKLHEMFKYLRGYLRPDGLAPLLGDADGGQVLPICQRGGDDHSYLLPLGAVMFDDPKLKPDMLPAPPELFWLLGDQGVSKYETLTADLAGESSLQFPNAGIYVLRDSDQYLLLNVSDAGLNGRGSHGHNDALSIEVSACGRAFIVDPGSYVYTADLHERHLFRSTAYHSTVQIDDVEQNETSEQLPFVIGNEARPELIGWSRGASTETVSAEHHGYERLPERVTHRRTVTFSKPDRFWLVEDEFFGVGTHKLSTRFHFDSGLEVVIERQGVSGKDSATGQQLLICPLDLSQQPELEAQFTSKDYGKKVESISACWTVQHAVPFKLRWALIPACATEAAAERLRLVDSLMTSEATATDLKD